MKNSTARGRIACQWSNSPVFGDHLQTLTGSRMLSAGLGKGTLGLEDPTVCPSIPLTLPPRKNTPSLPRKKTTQTFHLASGPPHPSVPALGA